MSRFQLFKGGKRDVRESVNSVTVTTQTRATNQRSVFSSTIPNGISTQQAVKMTSQGGQYVFTERKVISSSGVEVQNIQGGQWKTVTTQKTFTSADGSKTTTTVIKKEGVGTLPEDFSKQLYVTGAPSQRSTITTAAARPGPSKAAAKPATKPQSPEAFAKECLEAHNKFRSNHGTPPLKLSPTLCKYAEEWVQKLAREDKFQHRPNNKYGENIFMKWSSDPNYQITGNDPVDSWYAEIKDHDFSRETMASKSGHFTQVIWKGSQEMGVAHAKSKTGKILVVANYNPPGNLLGTFMQNVPRAK